MSSAVAVIPRNLPGHAAPDAGRQARHPGPGPGISGAGNQRGTVMRWMSVGSKRPDFAEFYRKSKDECLFTVLVSVGDRDAAQDLVAEAFARAWASWRTVSRHPAPAAWVVRTALNAHISGWRRRRREIPLADPGALAGPPAGDPPGG